MTTIANTEAGATGRYIDFGTSPANNVNVGAQTIIAYGKPTGSGGGGFGYYFGKTPAGTVRGPRFFVAHNANSPGLCFASDSGTSGFPQKSGTGGEVTYNSWAHHIATWDGSLNHSGIHLYTDTTESTYAGISGLPATDGFGSITSDSDKNLFLMNRGNSGNLAREFVGDVGYIARWNRVLNSTEITSVINDGPLSVPSGLILCWANQADLSPSAITPAGRSTHVDGSMPPNTALDGANLSIADATHAHAADNVVLTTDSTLAAADAAHAHAADNVTLDAGGSTTLAVADAAHAHAADNIVFTTDSTLAIADAAHNQSADNVNLSLAAPAGTSPGLYRPSMYPVYPPAQPMFRLRGEESPAEFGSFSARTELIARIQAWQMPDEYGHFRSSSRLSLAMTGTEEDDDMVAAFRARRMPSPAQMQKALPHLLRALNSIDAL